MSDIDFQNGFIVGMATRGITRSGLMYAPRIWNESGVYSYFYIDFKKPIDAFSTGMFNESVVVHDSVQLAVSDVTYVSPGVYKIGCDISAKPRGITLLNKVTSLLYFASGERVPSFSVHTYIEGQTTYINGGYNYDNVHLEVVHGWGFQDGVVETVPDPELWTAIDQSVTEDTAIMKHTIMAGSSTETISVILT